MATTALDKAIAGARALPGPSLWDALVKATGLSATELAERLLLAHNVHVLHDAALEQTMLAGACLRVPGTQAAWVNAPGGTFLLCEDPWLPGNMALLARRANAHAALALPGQLARCANDASSSATEAGPEPREPDRLTATAVEFVDAAIRHANREGASDIHFETTRAGIGVKYRIDGVMAPGPRLDSPARAEEVISRIKVMAQLDITERRRPQDGRIRWEKMPGAALDLRVSVMPSIFGEDAVLRVLDKSYLRDGHQDMTLASLGFAPDAATRIRTLAARPHGMLLVTGPTGSGKTTTVYAALTEVNDGLEKIVTIEDPVEYELPGVLQIPVNEQKGLTFATGLRSILRHDPDRILVGEIRDAETAEIAVQSSLTGHLVMTTVHANSLFDVLGRFQHFGIDPFGLASALNGVVVQRLLRKTCSHCAGLCDSTKAERELFAAHGLPPPERLPKARGCDACRQSGYRGRVVVAETHELEDVHRDLILRRASLIELRAALYPQGSGSLMGNALALASGGQTTLQEISRVVGM